MSANIPFEIQREIMTRILPVKSLIRFRSVSKQWKSLIDSSEFINDHSFNRTQPHHLLVMYQLVSEDIYVSFDDDDDNFPKRKFDTSVPSSVKLVSHAFMLDSSHGLVCIFGLHQDPLSRNNLVVLWNPTIKKSICMELPYGPTVVGFGVCPKTSDPKIFKITGKTSLDWRAEVFTLSSRAWKSVPMNLPYKTIDFPLKQVVIDGVIHWIATHLITNSGKLRRYQIISFDLTREEFGEIHLPDCLQVTKGTSIFKIKDSLGVLNHVYEHDQVEVWMVKKNGDSKSLIAKVFTVSFRASYDCMVQQIVGFRKNGQAIMHRLRKRDGYSVNTLEVYEPRTKHKNGPLITMDCYYSLFKMTSYEESLLLLNHSDSIIQ